MEMFEFNFKKLNYLDTDLIVSYDGGGCSGETLLDCLNDVESKLV